MRGRVRGECESGAKRGRAESYVEPGPETQRPQVLGLRRSDQGCLSPGAECFGVECFGAEGDSCVEDGEDESESVPSESAGSSPAMSAEADPEFAESDSGASSTS